ncbi:vomeronasal type-1 receptor 4-like [Rhynchocyon petersi]
MSNLGCKHFLNDSGCKLFFYAKSVGKGMSFGSTCLLSISQAITISPRNSRWAELRVKAPKDICSLIFLGWLLHLLVNIVFPMYVISNLHNKTVMDTKNHDYCSSVRHDKTADALYAALLSFPDVVCVGLMIWSSLSMIIILRRHKQQVRHLHRSNVSFTSSPETRATHTILVLVVVFFGACRHMLKMIQDKASD